MLRVPDALALHTHHLQASQQGPQPVPVDAVAAAAGAGGGGQTGGVEIITSNPVSLSNPVDFIGKCD